MSTTEVTEMILLLWLAGCTAPPTSTEVCQARVVRVAPQGTDVRADTAIEAWVADADSVEIDLFMVDGDTWTPMEVTLLHDAHTDHVEVVPEAELQPDTAYQVVITTCGGEQAYGFRTSPVGLPIATWEAFDGMHGYLAVPNAEVMVSGAGGFYALPALSIETDTSGVTQVELHYYQPYDSYWEICAGAWTLTVETRDAGFSTSDIGPYTEGSFLASVWNEPDYPAALHLECDLAENPSRVVACDMSGHIEIPDRHCADGEAYAVSCPWDSATCCESSSYIGVPFVPLDLPRPEPYASDACPQVGTESD